MEWVPGGEFSMGSENFYTEERPIRRVAVDGFWMDKHPVTAGEFRRFVRETGHVTVAERPLPPNGYGLFDATGNTWEWTTDWFSTPGPTDEPEPKPCCVPRNPRVASPEGSYGPGETIPRKVIKGGSHLCAPNYCLRYRPAARRAEAIDTSTSHIGFRCVSRTR
jgi:formylglycine-generating enzyme required for sulfatase activity